MEKPLSDQALKKLNKKIASALVSPATKTGAQARKASIVILTLY